MRCSCRSFARTRRPLRPAAKIWTGGSRVGQITSLTFVSGRWPSTCAHLLSRVCEPSARVKRVGRRQSPGKARLAARWSSAGSHRQSHCRGERLTGRLARQNSNARLHNSERNRRHSQFLADFGISCLAEQTYAEKKQQPTTSSKYDIGRPSISRM